MSGFSEASGRLTTLSLGTSINTTTTRSLLQSDNDLLATEGTFLDMFATIWDWGIRNLYGITIVNTSNEPINLNDSSTNKNVATLTNYMKNLNQFITKYNTYKSNQLATSTPDKELVVITDLISKYEKLPQLSLSDKDVDIIFNVIAPKSSSLRTILGIKTPNISKQAKDLNLTPDQAALFKLELTTDASKTKHIKLRKVQRVLANVISRLRLRRMVLVRLGNKPDQPTNVTEKILDVVHNLDTALTWMDSPTITEQDEAYELELKNLRDTRANIHDKLQQILNEINGKPSNTDNIDTLPEISDETGLTTPRQMMTNDYHDSSPTKRARTGTLLDNTIQKMVDITEPVEDNTNKIPEVIDTLKHAANLIQNIQTELMAQPDLIGSSTEDIAFILTNLSNSIESADTDLPNYPPPLPPLVNNTNSPSGGKKSHKTTRRNKMKGSRRRGNNKHVKTAKRMKRSTKKR